MHRRYLQMIHLRFFTRTDGPIFNGVHMALSLPRLYLSGGQRDLRSFVLLHRCRPRAGNMAAAVEQLEDKICCWGTTWQS